MSVIAWKDNCLAADRRVVLGDTIVEGDKIERYEDRIYGFVGVGDFGRLLIEWHKHKDRVEYGFPAFPACQKTFNEHHTAMIVIMPEHIEVYRQSHNPLIMQLDEVLAIGSGAEAALGAMYAGRSAVDAVNIASRINIRCGEGVTAIPHKSKPEVEHPPVLSESYVDKAKRFIVNGGMTRSTGPK